MKKLDIIFGLMAVLGVFGFLYFANEFPKGAMWYWIGTVASAIIAVFGVLYFYTKFTSSRSNKSR